MALYLVFTSSREFCVSSLMLFSINNRSFVCSSVPESIGQTVLFSVVEEKVEHLMKLTAFKDGGFTG